MMFCLLGFLSIIITTITCVVSHYYNKRIYYIIKIIVRAILLKIVEISVYLLKLFSTKVQLMTSLGPSYNIKMRTCGNRLYLTALLKPLFSDNEFAINSFNNVLPFQSSHVFSYQNTLCPRLVSLNEKYKLKNLLVESNNDFLQIVTIGNWVHSRWEHGTSGSSYFHPAGFNADKILSRAQLGDTFWCHVYSMTFIQVAASLGFQARLVSLTKDGYKSSDMHSVVEVWSNFFDKWIAIDIDFNIWYERDAVPMSVLEIHNEVISGNISISNVAKGEKRPSDPEFESRIPLLFEYYKYFFIDMRNDWLSNRYFRAHPMSSDKATLFWSDNRLPPVLNLFTKVDDYRQLYWKLNWTYMIFQPSNDNMSCGLFVFLSTLTPNFSHFECCINSNFTQKLNDRFVFWPLIDGENSLTVYSVNLNGFYGIKSHVSISIVK